MDLDLSAFNWGAVVASVIAGQVVSTVWFVVLFAQSWAEEYGAVDGKAHTSEIPGYTYGVQAFCTLLLVLSIALVQSWLSVSSAGQALGLGALISVGFCIATGLPGQAFLKRWRVAGIALGSQVAMIMTISLILGLWR